MSVREVQENALQLLNITRDHEGRLVGVGVGQRIRGNVGKDLRNQEWRICSMIGMYPDEKQMVGKELTCLKASTEGLCKTSSSQCEMLRCIAVEMLMEKVVLPNCLPPPLPRFILYGAGAHLSTVRNC